MKKQYKPKKGFLKIYSLDENNNKDILVDGKNLFVNTSFDIMAGALQGDVNKIIDTIAIGDGGIISSTLQTPTVNDTGLYSEIFRKQGTSAVVVESILEPNYITFKFVIEKTEANGTGIQVINEAGLFSADGTMFSRKTFQEAIKTPDKAFFIEWKLEF